MTARDPKDSPFVGASDDQKSELLKDILAFANTGRQSDAYILVGVEEVKGGRSIVRGVQAHLDDHDLQQFVTSKTQRPVVFSYQAFEIEGTSCGIIRVPVQERPIYLLKKYGRLDPNVVYIRRGSSTDQAKPDEIAKMGIASTESPKPLFEAYIQPRLVKPLLAEHPHSHSLRIVTWLFNQGRATADGVVVVLQEMPVGVLGLDNENWSIHRTAYPGTALALKQPLNPGGRVFLCSVSLGVAKFEGQQGHDQGLVVEHDNVDFKIKVLARDQTPVDLAVSYNRAELAELVCKKYSSG